MPDISKRFLSVRPARARDLISCPLISPKQGVPIMSRTVHFHVSRGPKWASIASLRLTLTALRLSLIGLSVERFIGCADLGESDQFAFFARCFSKRFSFLPFCSKARQALQRGKNLSGLSRRGMNSLRGRISRHEAHRLTSTLSIWRCRSQVDCQQQQRRFRKP